MTAAGRPDTAPDADTGEETLLEMLAAAAAARPGSQLDYLPKRLSPSRAKDYQQCPQLFYYKTVAAIRTPNTVAATRGTLAHYAFERIFDHPAGERTPDLAASYIAPAWQSLVEPDLPEDDYPPDSAARAVALSRAKDYRDLVPAGSDTEADLLAAAEECVRNWFLMERVGACEPTAVELPSGEVIDGRELHVAFDMFGMTLHGYIDRLDRYTDSNGNTAWSISDYKTSAAAPGFDEAGQPKYRPNTMDRIRTESFFQLRVYALLCWELHRIPVTWLRLVYVRTGDRDRGIKTMRVTKQIIDATRDEVRRIWAGATRSARTGQWETKTGPLCPYCYFQDICPAFSSSPAVPVTQDRTAAGT